MFRVAPSLVMKKLEEIFRHRVFKMLLAKGRITRDLIAMLSNWRHSAVKLQNDAYSKVSITATLTSSRKDQEYGAGGTGVPG